MSERESYKNGVPCWADLMSTDVAAANRFYAGLFGWEIESQGEEFGNYGMATLRGKTVAGVGPTQDPGMPSVWTTYLATNNIDSTVAKVKDAGGTIMMPPMDIGDAGRLAVCTDSVGAVVGFWQAKDHVGAQLVNEPGTMCWNELYVRDSAAADQFYAAVAGYQYEKLEGGMDYSLLKVDGENVGGRMNMVDEFPAEVPAHWLCYFAVADADAAAEKIRTTGGTVNQGPFDTPYGRMAMCTDPTGAAFAIIKLA
jgi:uncharacterized protein